jgi:uncharacterized protein (DUF2147 family)
MHISKAAILCLLLLPLQAVEPDTAPLGRWKTVDDHTGKPRSIVALYESNGRIFGRVEAALDPEKAGRRCDKCKDDRKDQPIVGMVIIRNMRKNGAEFSGGDILDPDNGSVYRCKMRLTDDGTKLIVRGFVGFSLLGRSQTWFREP